MVSDDDEVPLEHAIDFYRAVPDGEKPDLCNKILVDFLTLDPIATFAPIRRA
jgi:hypothetical protein